MEHHELRPDAELVALLRSPGPGGGAAERSARSAPGAVAGLLEDHGPRPDDSRERGARRVLPAGPDRQPALPGERGPGVADRSWRGVHYPRGARRSRRPPGGCQPRCYDDPLELHPAAGEPAVPRRVRIRALPVDTQLPLGVPAGAGPGASDAMTWRTVLGLLAAAAAPARAAQAPGPVLAQAESLRLAGRPWHAAQALLAAAARAERPNAEFIVRAARAELLARRYDQAKSLLAGQPWLEDYENGEALEVLATAELALGEGGPAGPHFALARTKSAGLRAALLAARAAVAFEEAGATDSAARYYTLARSAGLAAADPWLRLRLARVTRDTAAAAALLADLPAPAARFAPAARAGALLAAGDSAAALDAFALSGRLLDAARLALRLRDAELAYRASARDSALGPLAVYRRARVLVRLGDPGATDALSGFAAAYPADTAAPTALYVIGDVLVDRGDWPGAARWFGELLARYPADLRSSLARFRLAAHAVEEGRPDSAQRLYQSEADAVGPQRNAARFWLARLARMKGDTATALALWTALAHEDSIGYYGLRARQAAALPALEIVPSRPTPPPAAVARGLAELDTLGLAGLDSDAQASVRWLLARPGQDVDALLAWSEGLAARGWGSAAVRLAWQAATRAPNDPRVLRAIL